MAWHTRAQRTTIKCRRLAVCVAIPPEATFSLPLRLRLPFGFHLRADRISRISAEWEGRSSSRSIVGISSGTGKWDEAYSISIPRFPSRSSQAGASTAKGLVPSIRIMQRVPGPSTRTWHASKTRVLITSVLGGPLSAVWNGPWQSSWSRHEALGTDSRGSLTFVVPIRVQ